MQNKRLTGYAALNDRTFPLNTNTYPITRNIRVQLAVTVIVALLGIVSQLRLWKVIRQYRQNEAKSRDEEREKRDEAELEAGRQLEESNSRERKEWEARYGDSEAKSVAMSIQEVPDEVRESEKEKEIYLEKGDAVDVKSSANSYRCSECREREANGDNITVTAAEAADDKQKQHQHDKNTDRSTDRSTDNENSTPELQGKLPIPVFNDTAATQIKDDNQSEASAVIGSEAGTISGMFSFKRTSWRNSLALTSQSQEALFWAGGDDDAASKASAEGVVDEGSVLGSCRSSIVLGGDGGKHGELGVEGAELASKEGEIHQNTGLRVESGTEEKSSETQKSSRNQRQEQKHKQSLSEKAEEKPEDVPNEREGYKSQAELQNQSAASGPENHPAAEGKPEFPKAEFQTQGACKETAFDQPEKPAEGSQKDGASAPKDPKPAGSQTENQGKYVEHDPSTELKSRNLVEDQRQSENNTTKSSPKKEKATLNEDTVKHIPERTSKIVQSYRTNEWAKYLDDAEIPEPPPIQPIAKEQPKTPIKIKQTAMPVNVNELLQTPLNAQPPPAVEHFVAAGKEPRSSDEEGPRVSHESQLRQRQADVSHSNSNRSQPAIVLSTPASNLPQHPHSVQPAPAKEQQQQQQQQQQDSRPPVNQKQPKWKGPPPLLAVREDLMRNRVSSTSLSVEPWIARNSPRQSTFDTMSPVFPTFSIPEEDDNITLSQRRTMLQHRQQQTAQPRVTSPSAPPPHRIRSGASGQEQANNTQAIMAAWRHSVREDLREKQDPLGMGSTHTTRDSYASKQPPSIAPFGPSQRNASWINLHIENAIAAGMQRGDMNDLHREAMRRMQASANRRA